MSDKMLTDEENRIFNQDIIKGWALDYFYVYDNVPQHYIYHDSLIEGELTELERRNKAIVETLWLDNYNLYTVQYAYLYHPHALQLPLYAFIWGARSWPEESSEGIIYRSYQEIRAALRTWMGKEGWQLEVEERCSKPAVRERRILLGAPDRTMRLASVFPHGDRVVAEVLVIWTENGILKETAFVVVLYYDVDGTVLADRSYNDMDNWPSSPANWPKVSHKDKETVRKGQKKGWLDAYYTRYKDRRIEPDLTDMEKRNKDVVEGRWLYAYNTSLDRSIFHPERYRVQLPLQNVSFSGKIAQQIEQKIKEKSPDRNMRLVFTYARGNQVVVEGIISWSEEGAYQETPFISFLLFDKDGLIIRDRSYVNLEHFPGADEIVKILRLDCP
jgi:hypothetical protein